MNCYGLIGHRCLAMLIKFVSELVTTTNAKTRARDGRRQHDPTHFCFALTLRLVDAWLEDIAINRRGGGLSPYTRASRVNPIILSENRSSCMLNIKYDIFVPGTRLPFRMGLALYPGVALNRKGGTRSNDATCTGMSYITQQAVGDACYTIAARTTFFLRFSSILELKVYLPQKLERKN